MKIALLHPAFGAWGGAENLICWLAAGLTRRGASVTILTAFASPLARRAIHASGASLKLLTFMHGQPWERFQLTAGRGKLRPRLLPMADHVVRLDRSAMDRGAPGLARLLGGFDVVNAHNFPAMWWVAAARASAALPPVVWYCNEPSRSLYPGLFDGPSFSARAPDTDLARHDRACARAADVLIGNSAYVRDRVAAIYDRQDVRVVHCAIPLPPALPPRLPARVLRVLMVSRLTVEKNVETAIDAVGRLDRVALRIIGDGPERAALEAFARPLGDRVTFEGFLDDDSLRAAYAEADAFIYLPRGEPFGLTLLEAGAAGLPSITSSHGGPAEIVIDGETGLLVDPSSVDEVTGALGLLRDDPAARHLGEAARQRVESHFTIDRYVRDMEAVFSKLRT